MDKTDEAALKTVGGIFVTAAIAVAADYIACQIRNQRCVQQRRLDQYILPAIQSAFLSALLAKLFGPIPLPLQVVEFVFQNRDLLQNPCHTTFRDPYWGQIYSVCANPFGGWTVSFA